MKMISNNTYLMDIYNIVCSAANEINEARQTLGHFDYLTDDENILLRRSQHLLYQKLVAVGEDIRKCNEFQTFDSELPEPLKESVTSTET